MISPVLKWVTGGLEAFLGFPFLGGLLIWSLGYFPLFVMLALHIVTLVFSCTENTGKTGSILGIATSCIAWIPFLGMVMHILSATFLMLEAAKKK